MEERLRQLLYKQNPWWEGKEFSVPEFERDKLAELLKYAKHKQIIAVTGLRRVGKTVLLKQIIKKFLLETKGKNICYISLDDIDFQKYDVVWEAVNYFLDGSDQTKKRILFIDEIQKLNNFPDLLKTLYDSEENLKIYVSGSSSLEMKKYRESLAGRILTFQIPVLSYKEFVRYAGLKPEISWGEGLIREYDHYFAPNKKRYEKLFIEYLERGAFPELLEEKDEEYIKKYIKESVIEKTIADISRNAKTNEQTIYELLRMLCAANAQLFEFQSIAGNLKINRNQAGEYITLLEKSFLIKIAYNYTANVPKQIRTNKKQYIVHPSIIFALTGQPFSSLEAGEIAGHIIESITATAFEKTSFWRTPQKDEVDIILEGKKPLPIEVKYQTKINSEDIRSIKKFCEKYEVSEALMVTRDQTEKKRIGGIVVTYLPAWLIQLIEVSI